VIPTAGSVPLAKVIAALAVSAGVVLTFGLMIAGVGIPMAVTSGLGVGAIGLWATDVIPAYLVGLVLLLVAALVPLAPSQVVFAGFHATAFWLVFSGFVLGAAFRSTGLADRLAQRISARAPASYRGSVVLLVAVGATTAMLIPSSTVRVIMLVPVAVALAERMGCPSGTRGHCGLVFATIFGTIMPGIAILPANVLNLLLSGMTETLYGHSFSYFQWLSLLGPTYLLLQSLGIVLVILILFPSRREHRGQAEREPRPEAGRWTWAERRLIWILAGALSMWLTDGLHHISPAWIGLTAAVICLTPRIGFFAPTGMAAEINWGFLLSIAGILSYVAIVNHVGLAEVIGEWFVRTAGLAAGEPVRNYALITIIAAVLSMLATPFGTAAAISPAAAAISAATDQPVEVVQMTQLVGMVILFFPYQFPQVLVGMQLGGIAHATGVRMMASLAVFSIVVLLPFNYLWWRLIGFVQ